MTYLILDIATYIPITIIIIGLSLIINKFKLFNTDDKILFIYLLMSVVFDITSRVFSLYHGSNLIFINISSLTELLLLILYIKRFNNCTNPLFIVVFTTVLIFNLFELLITDFDNFETFQIYSKTINSIFALSLFINNTIKNIRNYKANIPYKLNLVFITYFSISIVINLPLNFLINEAYRSVLFIWLINIINVSIVYFSIIYYLYNKKNTL